MWCERREHLLAEYRTFMVELNNLAISVRGSTNALATGSNSLPENALIAATAIARADLRGHVDEHGCWTHAVYSSLFFLCRDHRADTPEANTTDYPSGEGTLVSPS
jgi:hypothetical protein